MAQRRMDTGWNECLRRDWPTARRSKSSSQKNLGGASLHPPWVPIKLLKEAYRFFLAFFFAAILFSSRTLLDFSASVADGARLHSSCIELQHYLVKRKVNSDVEKSELCWRILNELFLWWGRRNAEVSDGTRLGPAQSAGTMKFHGIFDSRSTLLCMKLEKRAAWFEKVNRKIGYNAPP